MNDIDYFYWIFAKITQGIVDLSADYIRLVQESKAVDVRGQKFTALELFDLWEDWKKFLFIRALYVMGSMGYYDVLGYDLSFCKPYLKVPI